MTQLDNMLNTLGMETRYGFHVGELGKDIDHEIPLDLEIEDHECIFRIKGVKEGKTYYFKSSVTIRHIHEKTLNTDALTLASEHLQKLSDIQEIMKVLEEAGITATDSMLAVAEALKGDE